ncbi:Protein URE2 [Penicillium rolfsii]|nr:Protein URE2 [Penicillium rolfsii]
MAAHLKPLVLHAHASGPNPIKIAIALESLNIPFTVKCWDFSDDPSKGVKGAEFLKINENGRVPALEDPNTGVVSWESGACMNYVRRVYDTGNKIGPSGGSGQDLVDFEKWEYFLLTTLGPMTGQVNWFRHYHPQKNEDALQRYIAQTYRCYDVLEKQLQKSEGVSILPGRVTAVDYHFEPWVRQYSFAGLSLDNYPMIHKWLGLMHAREEVQEAYCKVQAAAGK